MKKTRREIIRSYGAAILTGGIIMTCTACGNSADSSYLATESKTAATTVAQTTTARVTTYKAPEEYGKIIALTFDDGPSPATTAMVLDKLEKYDVKASFFLIGDNITDDMTDTVKRAYDMGCDIENHSKTHSYMTKMSDEDIKAEIQYTSDKIKEITGTEPQFFRPPYISVNQNMFDDIDLTFISGYGANDWVDTVTAEDRYNSVMEQAKDGAIILLHDAKGNQQTVDALDMIIPALQEQGYEFVTISELFYAKGVTLSGDQDIVYSYAEQTTMY